MDPSATRRTNAARGGRAIDPARRKVVLAIRSRFSALSDDLLPEQQVELDLHSVRPGLVIEHSVGEGGMGSVHAALDHGLRRRVAVKIMHGALDPDERSDARFVEEAQLTGQLEHPNIVPIHEIGVTADGKLYFAMKLVGGRTLAELLLESPPGAARGERDLHELVKVLVKVCDALAFAHAHGVVHRDLKPENVLVGEFGEVYVMDWGIALRSAVAPRAEEDDPPFARLPTMDPLGTIIGTPEFMAPEQARGDIHDIDTRTDVFGLGGILFTVLTGRAPHHETDDDLTIEAAQAGQVPPAQALFPDVPLPPTLCAIAARALSADPADRHGSAREFQEDLERFLRGGAFFPERTFEAGEWIVREGEEGDAAYVIVSGACEVVRQEATRLEVLRRMEAGEVFGEAAIFAQRSRSASVRAATHVRLTVVSREALLGEIETGSWITPFVRTLAQRFGEQSREVSELRDRATIAEIAACAARCIALEGAPNGLLEASLDRVASRVGAALNLEEAVVRKLLDHAEGLAIDGDRIRIAAP